MNTAKPRKPKAPGRTWALSGFLLGAIVSIGFNLQAAWLPADDPDTPEDWAPSIPSQIGAVVWPVALMVSVEVLSRVAWPTGQNRWGALGWGLVRFVGILAVAGGSGVISYGHIHEVLTAWKYGDIGAAVGPLVIDGLMLISGFALVSIGRSSRATLASSQEVVSAVLTATSPTPVVPALPIPPGGQEPAVPVTPPTPDTVTGTAPQEDSREGCTPDAAPATTSRPKRAAPVPAQPPTSREAPVPPSRPASRQEAPDSGAAGVHGQGAATGGQDDTREQEDSPVSAGRISDADALKRIRVYREGNDGQLPSANWMKQNLGMGAGRAGRLLKRVNQPDADLVELHTVQAAG